MTSLTDLLLVLLVLTGFRLLGLSRLGASIRTAGMQGVLLGLLPLVAGESWPPLRMGLLAGGSMVLKGLVFPWLLFRALREAEVRREIEPFVGFNLSLLAGTLCLGASLWLGGGLPLPGSAPSSLAVPAALFTIFCGLFLIVARKNALNQVVGYLVLENGIYVFGVTAVPHQPLLVELGVLLDVFVAVFVMGITVFHIQRAFDHIDTDQLSSLKD
ncbi:MAG: hydrogenase [Planctomycetes bacterium]|nr:hydrogenase [Planctomycetota bacterium]